MGLDAYGILALRLTGHVLPSLMPRPCLCGLHQMGTQFVTTTLRIHVPALHGGNRGCHAPCSVVAATDLDTPAASSSTSLSYEGDTTLWSSKIGSEVVGMLLCCASPHGAPQTEPLGMVCGCH